MTNPVKNAKNAIKKAVDAVILKIDGGENLPLDRYDIEIPGDSKNGDFSANAALVYARELKKAPRQIAEVLSKSLEEDLPKYVERIEIAGPGFINFYLKPDWFIETIEAVIAEKGDYGKSDYGKGEKVMVEFVSANPTGTMHIGNARGGAFGDILISALRASGYDATAEFYINDAGNQIITLGKSLEARYMQILLGESGFAMPEDGYQGEDIKENAAAFYEQNGDSLKDIPSDERKKALIDFTLPRNIAKMKADLLQYRVSYDVWFSEQSLYDDGSVAKLIEEIKPLPCIYEKDGALWFKTTDFGAEKDDVLVRENGIPTYFMVDIAYHINKIEKRKFEKVIDIWGADHHGHVARLKYALSALGSDGDKLDIVLMQLVRLIRDGEVVKMSKRTGKTITLDTLLEEVPADAARFLFASTSPSSHLEFDLDLAITESKNNPVYYVQYAHARICSLIKNLAAEGINHRTATSAELALLSTNEERELTRHIAAFTDEIISVARSYDSSRITRYLSELAAKFHKFYDVCRVKGEADGLLQARLNLCIAVQTTLKNALDLLKVKAPEIM